MVTKHGALLDVSRYSDDPLLELAVRSKDMNMLTLLLDLGADPGCSGALYRATLRERDMLYILLRAFCAKYPDGKKGCGAAALQVALGNQDFELLNLLLGAKLDTNAICRLDEYSNTENALAVAIRRYAYNNLDIITKLLSVGADPNGIASTTWYYFSDTVWPRSTVLLLAIRSKSKPLVELLIDAGADIHRAARVGVKRTPLQCACEVGSTELVDLLINRGANVNELPAVRGGGTSLQLCAIGGYLGIAHKLLQHGADVHADPSEKNGRTALEGAAEHGRLDMVRLLWDVSAYKTFSREECDRAMKLADENGHSACRDVLQELCGSTTGFVMPLLGDGSLPV